MAVNIEIWQPRWHDHVVLIAAYKVANDNIITFTQAKSMPGRYYISGHEIRKCPLDTNGTIDCYAVPLKLLKKIDDEG